MAETKKKILIVEDEKEIADPIQALLHLSGYETVLSMDGRDAVEKAREVVPDIILLDVMLPRLNGLDACKIIKEDPRLKQVPVIMLTGLNQLGDAEKAFEMGASDYLSKPFDVDRLIAKIKKLVGD